MKFFVTSLLLLGLLLRATSLQDAMPAFGLAQLREAIQTAHATTIEEIVPILRRNLGSNFTIVHHSESAQSGTSGQPRIVFWDEQAGFAAAFNGGDKNATENNSLEMWQFDFRRARFKFLRQEFPLKNDVWGQVQFAPVAQTSCLSCHGSDPRPIWGEYPKWQGVIGEDNDVVKDHDKALYEEFRRKAEHQVRYRALFEAQPEPVASSAFPFRDGLAGPNDIKESFQMRPNLRFNLLVSRLNTLRVARLMRENPEYQANIPLLLYGFMSCDGNNRQRTPLTLVQLAGVNILDVDLRAPFTSRKSAELAQNPSYFDGSASMNELISNEIFKDAVKLDPTYASVYEPRSLDQKYFHGRILNDFDREVFIPFDALGKWIPAPYPPSDVKIKHREPLHAYSYENWKSACDFLTAKLSPAQIASIQPSSEEVPVAESKVQAFIASAETSAPNALHYYKAYCAECHTARRKNLDFGINNMADLRAYMEQNGATLMDKVSENKMPRGLNEWTDRERQDWSHDRVLMLKQLEKVWRTVGPSSARAAVRSMVDERGS